MLKQRWNCEIASNISLLIFRFNSSNSRLHPQCFVLRKLVFFSCDLIHILHPCFIFMLPIFRFSDFWFYLNVKMRTAFLVIDTITYLKTFYLKSSLMMPWKDQPAPRLGIFKALKLSIENKTLMLLQCAILNRAPLKCRVVMTVIDTSFVSMTWPALKWAEGVICQKAWSYLFIWMR